MSGRRSRNGLLLEEANAPVFYPPGDVDAGLGDRGVQLRLRLRDAQHDELVGAGDRRGGGLSNAGRGPLRQPDRRYVLLHEGCFFRAPALSHLLCLK